MITKILIFFSLIILPFSGQAAQYIYSFQDASNNSLGTLTIDTSTLTPNVPKQVNSSIFVDINLHQGIYSYTALGPPVNVLTINASNQLINFTHLTFTGTFNTTFDLTINSDGNSYICCASPDVQLFTVSDPVMVVPEPTSLSLLLGAAAFTSFMKRRRRDFFKL